MMKWILILIGFISLKASAQEDSTRYQKYKTTYGMSVPRIEATSVFRLPDTSRVNAKPGAFGKNAAGTKIFLWDGSSWNNISGIGSDSTLISALDWYYSGDTLRARNTLDSSVAITDTSDADYYRNGSTVIKPKGNVTSWQLETAIAAIPTFDSTFIYAALALKADQAALVDSSNKRKAYTDSFNLVYNTQMALLLAKNDSTLANRITIHAGWIHILSDTSIDHNIRLLANQNATNGEAVTRATADALKADKATTLTINGTAQDLSTNRSWTVNNEGIYKLRTYYRYTTQYPYSIDVWRNEDDTTYYTNYNWDEVKNKIPGSTVYIDPVNGKDSVTKGTLAAPFKTLRYVHDSTTYQDWRLKSGSFFRWEYGLKDVEVNRDIKMSVYGGTVKPKVTVAKNYVWTLDPSSGGTTWYTDETITLKTLIDTSHKDEYGHYKAIFRATNAAAVYTTPDSYYYSAVLDKIYVHTHDGRAPDSAVYVMPQEHAFRFASSSTSVARNAYFEDIEFWGGNVVVSAHNDDSLKLKSLVARRCNFFYSCDDGISTKGNTFSAFDHCTSAYTNDNHDYTAGATLTNYSSNGFEYYSHSTHATDRFNGVTVGDACNGSTSHVSSKVLRVGGYYAVNEGRNLADIDSTVNVNIGLTSAYSIAGPDTSKVGFAPGSINDSATLSTRKGNYSQIINSTSIGNYRALQVGYNATLDTLGFTYTEPTFVRGTVRSLRNYVVKAVGSDSIDRKYPELILGPLGRQLTIKGGNTITLPDYLSAADTTVFARKLLQITGQTANYTLVLADAATLIRQNVASANTVTIPPNSSVAFPIGTQIIITQTGAGQITFTAGAGVTINSAGGATKSRVQYSTATIIKTLTDTWLLSGDISL